MPSVNKLIMIIITKFILNMFRMPPVCVIVVMDFDNYISEASYIF